MFFFIDLDDLFDGMTASVGIAIKLIFLLLFIGLPIAFFERGGLGVILAIIIGLLLATILLSAFCVYQAIKILIRKTDSKISSKIYLITFIVLSILGLFMPNNISITHYSFYISKLVWVVVLPLIANILYIFSIYGDFKLKTHKLSYTIEYGLWEPLKKIILSMFIPTIIVYWVVLIFYLFASSTPKVHDIYNNLIDKTANIFTYYDNSYDVARNNVDTKEIIEKNIAEYSNNMPLSKEEIIAQTSKIGNGKFPELFWNDETDRRLYTYAYIDNELEASKELEEKGIKIKNSQIIDENNIYLEYYDKSQLKEYVCKFNLESYKITDMATYFELHNQFYINNNKRLKL